MKLKEKYQRDQLQKAFVSIDANVRQALDGDDDILNATVGDGIDDITFTENDLNDMFPAGVRTYEDEMRNFAKQPVNTPILSSSEDRPAANDPARFQRSSLASFESFERRMAARGAVTHGGQPRQMYSSTTLRAIHFVRRRLSIGSVVSKCSKTTILSSSSQRISWSSIDSAQTITPLSSSRGVSSDIIEGQAIKASSTRREFTTTVTQNTTPEF